MFTVVSLSLDVVDIEQLNEWTDTYWEFIRCHARYCDDKVNKIDGVSPLKLLMIYFIQFLYYMKNALEMYNGNMQKKYRT